MSVLDQLTKRQASVYEFIRDKIVNRGYGPTVREIGERFNISSPNGVMCHLKALEKKGLIRRMPNKSRAIELTREAVREASGIPMAGVVAAGLTSLASFPVVRPLDAAHSPQTTAQSGIAGRPFPLGTRSGLEEALRLRADEVLPACYVFVRPQSEVPTRNESSGPPPRLAL